MISTKVPEALRSQFCVHAKPTSGRVLTSALHKRKNWTSPVLLWSHPHQSKIIFYSPVAHLTEIHKIPHLKWPVGTCVDLTGAPASQTMMLQKHRSCDSWQRCDGRKERQIQMERDDNKRKRSRDGVGSTRQLLIFLNYFRSPERYC